MPPFVSTFGPWDRLSGAFEHEDVLDLGALLERGIDNRLGGNGLSAAPALIGGNDDAGLTIDNPLTK